MKSFFNREEAEQVLQALESWEGGMAEARQGTIEDHTLRTPEELLDLMSGYDESVAAILTAREKVKKCL